MERPLLHPLDETSLRPRPAPVACGASDVPPRWRAPVRKDEANLQAADFQAVPCPQDGSGDAVPTSQMPVPACVPLGEDPFAPRRRVWPWLLGTAVLCALAVLGWWIFRFPK